MYHHTGNFVVRAIGRPQDASDSTEGLDVQRREFKLINEKENLELS
jgi:hypothetical protein